MTACMNGDYYDQGQYIIENDIDDIKEYGDNQHSIELLNTLISFYAHFDDLQHAKEIFNSIPRKKRDTMTVNAMMKCCINNNEIHLEFRCIGKLINQDI